MCGPLTSAKKPVACARLPQVQALFERYDVDRSGTISFREFSQAFLSRHAETTEPIQAAEYKNPPKVYKAGFDGEPTGAALVAYLNPRFTGWFDGSQLEAAAVAGEAALLDGWEAGSAPPKGDARVQRLDDECRLAAFEPGVVAWALVPVAAAGLPLRTAR